jgi:DNA-directed RNA polymerase I, II, and III subunit RPABC2
MNDDNGEYEEDMITGGELHDEEDDEDSSDLFQKLNPVDNDYYVKNLHSECITHNFEEVIMSTIITRDDYNNIIDDMHKTLPILTKYEKTRILGQRATQIDQGSTPFVIVPHNIIDSYDIAVEELIQKKIPFIIKRPLPHGGCEYWNIQDLELI